jgi:putative hydrolase of the HAD superfamily
VTEAPSGALEGLLLDVGGVLLRTPWELLDHFEQRHGWPPGTLPWRGPVDPSTDPLWRAVQAGRLLSGEYFDRRAGQVSRLLGVPLTWPEFTRALFEAPEGLAVRPEGRALVADARSVGLRTGILTSKLIAFLSRAWIERSSLLSSFDVLLDQSETGLRKPDLPAYHQAVEAMGLEPAGTLFVDDDPANVDGAVAAGLQAVRFDVTDPAGSFARVRRRLDL